jgi:hypothetical protein
MKLHPSIKKKVNVPITMKNEKENIKSNSFTNNTFSLVIPEIAFLIKYSSNSKKCSAINLFFHEFLYYE